MVRCVYTEYVILEENKYEDSCIARGYFPMQIFRGNLHLSLTSKFMASRLVIPRARVTLGNIGPASGSLHHV